MTKAKNTKCRNYNCFFFYCDFPEIIGTHLVHGTFPLLKIPLLVPVSTYLAPSSCDRNRPPPSQVACKLLPFCPHCSLLPSPPNSQPLLGFPEPNVHLIRRITNPFPSVQNINNDILLRLKMCNMQEVNVLFKMFICKQLSYAGICTHEFVPFLWYRVHCSTSSRKL